MKHNQPRYHLIKDFTQPLSFGDIYLRQIGRRFCKIGERVSTHAHDNWFELTIVTKGSGNIVSNGKSTAVSAGDIYLSLPFDLHELESNNDRLEYDFFAFFTENPLYNEEFSNLTQLILQNDARVFRDEKINSLVANAILEFSIEKTHSKALLESIFQQIVIYLLRNFNDLQNKKTSDVSSSDVLCFQLMNYIDTHIYEIERLETIAPYFHYNYSYLSTLFKRTTGKTLSEYYNQRRLDTAKALLGEKKKKIGDIALLLNYSSTFSFSKAFKNRYGISPKNLQKSL